MSRLDQQLILCRFIPGHSTLAATVSMSAVLTTLMTLYLRRENRRRDALAASINKLPEQYTEEERFAERENGDNATFYRYTV
jgi:hypothetical protein